MNRLKWIAPSLVVGLISVLPVAAQSPAKLREWIASHIEDLPNFVCDYTEKQYGAGRWNHWSLKSEHQGEVRYVNGNDEYRVLSIDGAEAEAPIWELSKIYDPFADLRYKLSPIGNYWFMPKGRDKFTFRSDWGRSLFNGYTKDGKPLPGRSYPTWGTIWIDKQTHAVRKLKEHFKVPKDDPMFSHSHGEREIVVEYEDVSIGEKTYTMPARAKYETKGALTGGFLSFGRSTPHWRTVRTYENCRRFQVDSSIQYGDIAAAELPASGPTSSPAPKPPGPDISKYPGVHPTAATTTTSGTTTTGGTGDELGTTTLEVGVDLDSARSPNIPPQAPPAAPQPPLSKAVRTSPKRNAPSEDRDPLSRYGYDQSSPSSTKEKDDLFEGDLISRYGYHEEPPSSEEDRPLLKRYGYYAYSDSLPPPEEEEDEQVSIDRSAFWWFSMGGIVAGIVAFAAAFVGSFFGNSLRRHRG